MHCTKMHHFCGLKFASCHAICIYCIIRMHPTHASCMLHLTHYHLCIVIGFPCPFIHLRVLQFATYLGSLSHYTSHLKVLKPAKYPGISIPLHNMRFQSYCIAYLGSLSYCTSHLILGFLNPD